MKKLSLGIMQGRFTSKNGFFPQKFPWGVWKNEFYKGYKYGIDAIEWMFNKENFFENPVWTKRGQKEICETIESSGVQVSSICANYFMNSNLFSCESLDVVKRLIEAGDRIGARQIIVPLFDASEPKNSKKTIEIFELFESLLEGTELKICFESNLSIEWQKSICNSVNSPKIGICYDVGNATGEGYNCIEDLEIIKWELCELHIKDKTKRDRQSVMVGEGSVDFKDIFQMLKLNNELIYTMETYFGADAEKDTAKNIQYIKEILEKNDK